MVNFGEKHTSWFDLYTHIVEKTLCIHDKKITCFMLLSNYIPYLPFLFHRVRICILWRYEKCYKTRSRRMNSSTLCSHAPYSWHHCKKCVSKNVELSYQAFWKRPNTNPSVSSIPGENSFNALESFSFRRINFVHSVAPSVLPSNVRSVYPS